MSQFSRVEPLPDTKDIGFTPPRWVSWLIALVPVFPPLYLAAFASLGLLRKLPLTTRYVLFFFASTQLLAALFTPRPLLSLGLAAARTLFILAMISAGVYLQESRNLRPLLTGYMVVFLTAWIFTFLTGKPEEILLGRLGHPLYYFVSLGLIACVALWIQLDSPFKFSLTNISALLLATATLLASGSRGPLLAFFFGSFIAAFFGNSQYIKWTFSLLACLLIAIFLLSSFKQTNSISRLGNIGLTGRNQIWHDAYYGFTLSPIGGQGPYQSGPYLSYLYRDPCQLTPTLESAGVQCPKLATDIKGAWSTAHNLVLHSLLETGIIGTLGLILLLLWGAWVIYKTKSAFSIALYSGYMLMSFTDVVTSVPSPHFSELFWVIIGLNSFLLQKKSVN